VDRKRRLVLGSADGDFHVAVSPCIRFAVTEHQRVDVEQLALADGL
jgi:hypothetical protein